MVKWNPYRGMSKQAAIWSAMHMADAILAFAEGDHLRGLESLHRSVLAGKACLEMRARAVVWTIRSIREPEPAGRKIVVRLSGGEG